MFSRVFIVRLVRSSFGCKRDKKIFNPTRFYHWADAEDENAVPLVQIKKVIKTAALNYVDGHACITMDCPICAGAKRKDQPKVFINKTTGFFLCDNCRHSGPWSIIEKFLTPRKSGKIVKELAAFKETLPIKQDFKGKWDELKATCQLVTNLTDDEYQNMLQHLGIPPVPKETLSILNCVYSLSTKTLYLPLTDSSSNVAGYKSVTEESEDTTPAAKAGGVIIYKQKGAKTDSNSHAVVVPSVRDLLALISQRAATHIVCLPHELKNLPQQALPIFENYKKLVLWFGNDETSWDTARNFAKKLDEKRCFFVRPTGAQPDPKTAAYLGHDLKSILQNAQPIWHKSITTFQSLRQDVLSDLQNIDRVQGVKWKRYPTLNRILKGHRKGEFTVLTGPTGSGKTTFMSEYSLDLAMQGVNTLWGSFEIRNARLARTMLQQMAGMPLDVNLDLFDTYADEFEKLPIYFMTFHGQQSVKVVMEAVEHATYVHDIAHVIIDNVQFMMGISDEQKHMDRFWKQDAVVAAFRTFATKFNCHVTLVIHPRKERDADDLTTSSIFGGAKASQEADNILIIQDKRLTSVRGKKYLQVAKNRYSGDLGVMMMDFDKASLSYAPKRKSKTEADQVAAASDREDSNAS
ncbi:mitochondrial DNA helicase isoform X1 [Neodiprion virginianus]|uniref:mitochondrial DNA helicase isoform X1 n=1 Tax=Neodiprion fabricii TaxID=2872261 RepID=UPI001ED95512|nr:mitochondrial DNA helicase isoform X1 [Neodiprion fabricii]XP_046603245.1 mitochondrial DNA helicase isoform X1 [Neodiprion virginianus]